MDEFAKEKKKSSPITLQKLQAGEPKASQYSCVPKIIMSNKPANILR